RSEVLARRQDDRVLEGGRRRGVLSGIGAHLARADIERAAEPVPPRFSGGRLPALAPRRQRADLSRPASGRQGQIARGLEDRGRRRKGWASNWRAERPEGAR